MIFCHIYTNYTMLELHIKQGLKLLCEAQAQDSDQMAKPVVCKGQPVRKPFLSLGSDLVKLFSVRFWC